MTINSLAHVPDRTLIDATVRAAADSRRSIVELLTLLGEIDTRRLYLAEGFPSLFAYCTQALHFSEHEAYHRIEAARAARAFPEILDRLREGALTLTSVTLLRPHLTTENSDALIAAALHKSRREVECQMAALAPKAEVKPIVRRLPSAEPRNPTMLVVAAATETTAAPPIPPRSISQPLSSDRYLLRVTLTADAHAALQRARDLLRHSVPDGDPAAIVGRALTLLVGDLERRRAAKVHRPRQALRVDSHSRHVPAAVRREVWKRDQGRCAFIGRCGRCRETGHLEFHHVRPFALGGATTIQNIELRCRAHNQYEGTLLFGPGPTAEAR